MTYLHWLVQITVAFVVAERLFPWRRAQPFLRPGWGRDLAFLAVNGHVFGLATAALNAWLALRCVALLRPLGLAPEGTGISRGPFLAQFAALLVASYFLQWGIHNLLHRVPFLWTFHKVHHSIAVMDFVGNFRFHFMEIVVYKSLQWLPLAWLGASSEALLAVAVLSTLWGDFNHSNLRVGLGPLGYVFNNPKMHLWHHDASTEGGVAKNFGVVFSLWDFLFRTAYWPRDRSPERLGYPGDAEMPQGFVGQFAWPLTRAGRGPAREASGAPPGPPG